MKTYHAGSVDPGNPQYKAATPWAVHTINSRGEAVIRTYFRTYEEAYRAVTALNK
jgi:hypothetical protein